MMELEDTRALKIPKLGDHNPAAPAFTTNARQRSTKAPNPDFLYGSDDASDELVDLEGPEFELNLYSLADSVHPATNAAPPPSRPLAAAKRRMLLLPGERPLQIERHFGESIYVGSSGNTQNEVPASSLPVEARYDGAIRLARASLERRAMSKFGAEFAAQCIQLAVKFERVCLSGIETDAETSSKFKEQLCVDYTDMLRKVYGPELVLDAYTLDKTLLDAQEGQEDLQLLRCMERRFLIWEDSKPANVDTHPVSPMVLQQAPTNAINASAINNAAAAQITAVVEAAGNLADDHSNGVLQPQNQNSTSSFMNNWDVGLKRIWTRFLSLLEGKTYQEVNLQTQGIVSCALNNTKWIAGNVIRYPLGPTSNIVKAIQKCQNTNKTGRLYLTDGSMMDYEATEYPRNAPGVPCKVDEAVNSMMPHAVASTRSTNLFHAVKNESTGTRTFTLFAPIGGGTNLTAFHYETKKRRSYNCGAGDLIIQPLATLENNRKLMRIHAAVAGIHLRHGQLLPLECYLEEGVQLVVHIRNGQSATLCELPEQSMHAFVSYGDVRSSPPALKVSCNDFDLVWEVASAYWLEKVATAYNALELLVEEGLPPDGADTWIQSSYLTRLPCGSQQAKKPSSQSQPGVVDSAAAVAHEMRDTVPNGQLVNQPSIESRQMATEIQPVVPAEGDAAVPVTKSNPETVERVVQQQQQQALLPTETDKTIDAAANAVQPQRPGSTASNSSSKDDQHPRPWMYEQRNADLSQLPDVEEGQLHWSMEVIAVRLAEKLLDIAEGHLQQDQLATWAGELPTQKETLEALRNLLPALKNMLTRADAFDALPSSSASLDNAADMLNCGFKFIYLKRLHDKVSKYLSLHDNTGNSNNGAASLDFAKQLSTVLGQQIDRVSGYVDDMYLVYNAEELSRENSPAVLRMLWMICLELEWQAAIARPCDFKVLARRRRDRHKVECAWEVSCTAVVENLKRGKNAG